MFIRLVLRAIVFTPMLMLGVIMMGTTANAYAGGVALGATRVIYPQGNKQVSLPVTNSSASNVFLIQSWVANADGTKSTDFVITPPLFVIQPKKENVLRIMYVGPTLPTDRESVFYLNSKAIPSVDKRKLQGNVLQIATQSVIKLFIRPKNLPTPSIAAPAAMRCHLANGKVTLSNPSPYYVSLVEFSIGNVKQTNTMVPPKGSLMLNAPGDGRVKFETVNDFGANTPLQTCTSG
ncbi:fimbria/pilus periplasmic chaperone [Superficieibacter electus]